MATHFASPHSPRPPQDIPGKMPPMAQEDIGSVLNRFHEWAGHTAEPIRELSYEEAVKRSRRHVYADDAPVSPAPVKAAAPPEPQPAAAAKAPAAKTKAARPAPAGNGKSTRKTAAAAKPGRASNKKAAKPASRKAAAQPSPKNSAAAAREATQEAAAEAIPTPHADAVSAYQAVQQAAAEIVPPPAPPPSFEQVLAAQVHPSTVPLALRADTRPVAPLAPDAPAVHLTVRFATEERNMIRERAHDLGITPAAYMRHCILEIDSLRAELESAKLAYAHASTAALAANSADSAAFAGGSSLSLRQPLLQHPADGSWLTRVIRLVLPGRAKGRAFATHA